MAQRQYYLYLSLKDDAELIQRYEEFHRPENVWPEVILSIKESGIVGMRIFRTHIHLVMAMTVNEDFSFERKQKLELSNSKVQEWEALMEQFQARAGVQKWQVMEQLFDLNEV